MPRRKRQTTWQQPGCSLFCSIGNTHACGSSLSHPAKVQPNSPHGSTPGVKQRTCKQQRHTKGCTRNNGLWMQAHFVAHTIQFVRRTLLQLQHTHTHTQPKQTAVTQTQANTPQPNTLACASPPSGPLFIGFTTQGPGPSPRTSSCGP